MAVNKPLSPYCPFLSLALQGCAGASPPLQLLCALRDVPRTLLSHDLPLASDVPFGGESWEKKLSSSLPLASRKAGGDECLLCRDKERKSPFLAVFGASEASPGTACVSHSLLQLGFPTVVTGTLASLAQLWDG